MPCSQFIIFVCLIAIFVLLTVAYVNYAVDKQIRNYIVFEEEPSNSDNDKQTIVPLKSKYNLDMYIYLINMLNKCDEYVSNLKELKELKDRFAEIQYSVLDGTCEDYVSDSNVSILGKKNYNLLYNSLTVLDQVYLCFCDQIPSDEQKKIAVLIDEYIKYVEEFKNTF